MTNAPRPLRIPAKRSATEISRSNGFLGAICRTRLCYDARMLRKLGPEDRLRLMKFLCSFAWADLRVHEKEKVFIRKMVKKLSLDAKESAAVENWLKVPPRADEVDPQEIPADHRQFFVDSVRAIILADGEVDPEERISLSLLEELLS